jgi:ribosome biogenesis GTPase
MSETSHAKKPKLEDFGYDAFFESNRKKLKLDDFSVARVISEHKGAYRVINPQGAFLATITGKQMFAASLREDYPAVGDWVAIDECGPEKAVIRGILPRKTVLTRNRGDRSRTGSKTAMQVIGANIDVAFIVESVDRDYSLNRFERYFALAENGGVTPAIILNKTDLLSEEELAEKQTQLRDRFPGTEIILTSTTSGEGVTALADRLHSGTTYCFLGSSGVGKSSLISTLLGDNTIKTGSISDSSGRGKHVTTTRQMYFLKNGGIVIDNPGIREVGMTDANAGIDSLFDEITNLGKKCKYADCTHQHEAGCAVLAAAKSGILDEAKYGNYLSLKKETEYYEMSEFEKREKDRRFGKFLKKAKKELRDLDA